MGPERGASTRDSSKYIRFSSARSFSIYLVIQGVAIVVVIVLELNFVSRSWRNFVLLISVGGMVAIGEFISRIGRRDIDSASKNGEDSR